MLFLVLLTAFCLAHDDEQPSVPPATPCMDPGDVNKERPHGADSKL